MRSVLRNFIHKVAGTDLTHATDEAKTAIRTRLNQRPLISVESIINGAGLPPEEWDNAHLLLDLLADVLGVAPGVFRADDSIRDLVTVPHASLSKKAQAVLREWKIGDPIEQFTYDLLAALDRRGSRRVWKKQWQSLPTQPRDDEQWLDVIVSMNMSQFLVFFAPILGDTPAKQG